LASDSKEREEAMNFDYLLFYGFLAFVIVLIVLRVVIVIMRKK